MDDDLQFHPINLASDTLDLKAGPLTRIGDALTKGVGAAAVSGGLSIANTIVDYVGGDKWDVQDTLRKVDDSWGDYYKENQSAIDTTGFIGTAILPGMAGTKGIQLLRSGVGGTRMGEALNFAASRRDTYLKRALQETAESGGTIKGILSENRLRYAAWEMADQALLATGAELAIAATMNDSSVFQGDTWKDFAWNGMIGTAVGGVAGGLISSIAAKGILKSAQSAIESRKRVVDTLDPARGATAAKGSDLLLFAEQMVKLSDDASNIPFSYKVDGKLTELEGGLQTTEALKKAHERALRTAENEFRMRFNELADGNAAVGQAYHKMISGKIAEQRALGMTEDDIIASAHGLLNNVTKVSHLDLDRLAADSKKFYVTLEPASATLEDIFSKEYMRGKTGKQAFRMVDGTVATDLKVVKFVDTGYDSAAKAFKGGIDADVIMMPGGKAAINPNSAKIVRTLDNPYIIRSMVDLETGTIADEAVATFADVLTKDSLKVSAGGIEGSGKFYRQRAESLTDISKSPIEASARFAWLSQLDNAGFNNAMKGNVDSHDLAALSRLTELVHEKGPEYFRKIEIRDGDNVLSIDDIADLRLFLQEKKYEVLAEQLAEHGAYDTRHLAAHINASRDYVEDAIRRNFVPPAVGDAAVADLRTADALIPKTVMIEHDFNAAKAVLDPIEAYRQNFGPSFLATQELTMQYQQAVRQQVADNAVTAALGEDAKLLYEAAELEKALAKEGIDTSLAKTSSQRGAGAGLFTAANANYQRDAEAFVQSSGAVTSLLSKRRGDAAVLALSSVTNAVRMNPAAGIELGVLTNALRKSEFRYAVDPDGEMRLVSTEVRKLMQKENVSADIAAEMVRVKTPGAPRVPHIIPVENRETLDFLSTFAKVNGNTYDKMVPLRNAAGVTMAPREFDSIYIPPVDTVRYKYYAHVSTKEAIGVASETTMLTARTEAELRAMVNQIDPSRYDVRFASDTAAWHKAKGEYDYAQTLHEARINSDLARTGALADFFPKVNAEEALADFLRHAYRQEESLVRTAVQVKNRQFFSEMKFLSDNYRVEAESTFQSLGSRWKKQITDPFGDHIKTALNISKQQEFPLLDAANDFIDRVGVAIGERYNAAFKAHTTGEDVVVDGVSMKPWVYADKVAKEAGLGMPYSEASDVVQAYMAANASTPRNVIRETMQKANMLLANFTLRLDFANSLINMISTPIMMGTEWSSIQKLIKDDEGLGKLLNDLTRVKVPGQEFSVPSFKKVTGNSISNFFGPEKAALLERYTRIGAVKDILSQYHAALDDIAIDGAVAPLKWVDKVNGHVDKLAKYTGNNFSEEFTRFVSADVMRQLTDPLVAAGKMAAREQDTYIMTFVNRTQGNYVTSQRPIVFQGTTGAAVSLFQTYAFNVLQQLHRHVEAGDKRTLAVFAGLQSSVFGLNGLPFFDAVNTHLIGGAVANNPQHKDAYSVLPAFNKELGDWLLYGTASAFPLLSGWQPALYTRGDINPRHLTILPNSIADVPAVSAGIKLASTVYQMGKDMAGGADLGDTFLAALEHQGLNRPLAGMAQVLGGKSTTSQGSLISAANDLQTTSWLANFQERMVNYGGAGRLMGARPMDEAVALNQLYRNKGYEAMDKARLANLGRVVKTKLEDGQSPSKEEMEGFMEKYVRSGGRIENFNQAMMRWMKDANVSVVNQTAQKMNSPYAAKMKQIMGGEELTDFRNQRARQADDGTDFGPEF
jgi:hypothetical protein